MSKSTYLRNEGVVNIAPVAVVYGAESVSRVQFAPGPALYQNVEQEHNSAFSLYESKIFARTVYRPSTSSFGWELTSSGKSMAENLRSSLCQIPIATCELETLLHSCITSATNNNVQITLLTPNPTVITSSLSWQKIRNEYSVIVESPEYFTKLDKYLYW